MGTWACMRALACVCVCVHARASVYACVRVHVFVFVVRVHVCLYLYKVHNDSPFPSFLPRSPNPKDIKMGVSILFLPEQVWRAHPTLPDSDVHCATNHICKVRENPTQEYTSNTTENPLSQRIAGMKSAINLNVRKL